MAGCERAHLVVVETPHQQTNEAVAGVQRHLALHGIDAPAEVLFAGDVDVMTLVLSRVSDLEADLLVIGAHRHTLQPGAAPTDVRAVMRRW